MTQRQLDLRAPSYEPNIIPLGLNHSLEIRNKGQKIGIYTLSGADRKKRGVSLPVEAWMVLQQQLPLINLNIQFATGTVGVDIFETTPVVHVGYAEYKTDLYDGLLYDEEAGKPDVRLESLPENIPQWHAPYPIQQPCVKQYDESYYQPG